MELPVFFGKNLCQIAKALINIAHPDDMEMPEKPSFERSKQFYNVILTIPWEYL
jgi:hypothetical protein